jgi:hypothetical protein
VEYPVVFGVPGSKKFKAHLNTKPGGGPSGVGRVKVWTPKNR